MRILASDGIEKGARAALEALGHEVVEQFYEVDELNEQVKNFDVLVVRSATKVRKPTIDALVRLLLPTVLTDCVVCNTDKACA